MQLLRRRLQFAVDGTANLDRSYNKCVNRKYRLPEISMAAGSVNTHASAMLPTVDHCSPEPFAAIVPAMPDESRWVVETGSP